MAAWFELLLPLKRMAEMLEIDIDRMFRLVPEEGQAAIAECRRCKSFHTCDYQVETRYFDCPNREFFDDLVDRLDDDG